MLPIFMEYHPRNWRSNSQQCSGIQPGPPPQWELSHFRLCRRRLFPGDRQDLFPKFRRRLKTGRGRGEEGAKLSALLQNSLALSTPAQMLFQFELLTQLELSIQVGIQKALRLVTIHLRSPDLEPLKSPRAVDAVPGLAATSQSPSGHSMPMPVPCTTILQTHRALRPRESQEAAYSMPPGVVLFAFHKRTQTTSRWPAQHESFHQTELSCPLLSVSESNLHHYPEQSSPSYSPNYF